MSREQHAGQNNNIKNDYSSYERVEQLKYLGKALTNHNSTHEEIESRLKSRNAGYQSVQNICLPVCYPKI
jgi:hypothetical protein